MLMHEYGEIDTKYSIERNFEQPVISSTWLKKMWQLKLALRYRHYRKFKVGSPGLMF